MNIKQFDAIRKLYPNMHNINGEESFDEAGNKINVDMNSVNNLISSEQYMVDRRDAYQAISNQLDQLYHDMTAGKLDATGEWHKAIKAVKDANPKP